MAGHAVHAADAPAGAGLFEAAADPVYAGTFDLAAADRAAFGETLGIVQMRDMVAQIVPQACQRWAHGGRNACLPESVFQTGQAALKSAARIASVQSPAASVPSPNSFLAA